MNPRLLLLLAVAAVLAALLAIRASTRAPVPGGIGGPNLNNNDNGSDPWRELKQRWLPGESPPKEPELDIQVEVNTSSGKNRLDYYSN